MQKHWDVMRSDNGGDNWQEVSGNLPTDFGFAIDVHAHEPETIYVVPIKSDSEHFPIEGKLRVYRSRTGGNEWEALTKGLPQRDCYVNVLRDAMAVDHSIPAACISAPPAARCMPRPTPETTGRPSCAICRPCCLSRCRRCNDSGVASRNICELWHASRAARCRSRFRAWLRSARCSTHSRPCYPMLCGTMRDHDTPSAAPSSIFRLRGGSVPRAAGRSAARRGRDRSRALSGDRGHRRRLALCCALGPE